MFSQFGNIESYTYLRKSFQRNHTAILITYDLSVDLNKIVENYQGIRLDENCLHLRRLLPRNRPMFERVLATNKLIISLNYPSNDDEFNENNIRKYFSKYGSIISCRILIDRTEFLIEFIRSDTVDAVIVDEPHYYNDQQLILRKYVSSDQVLSFHSNAIPLQSIETIRRLKDLIEALELSYEVELKLIRRSCQEKLSKCIERMKNRNQALKSSIEDKQRMRKSKQLTH